MNKINKAIKCFGTSEFGRWMLDDGRFLAIYDGDDHRIVQQFCENSWLEFIKAGCITIHYDRSAKYLWIRINGFINTEQRSVFYNLFEDEYLKVNHLYVQIYDGDKYNAENDLQIKDSQMAYLFLTDTVAYNLEKQYEENAE